MAFDDEYDFHDLQNGTEPLVIRELGTQLGEILDEDICKCQDCVLDMAAFALNALKPTYRVSLLGSLYTKNTLESEEFLAEVKKTVEQAIQRISRNPSHDL